jgi:phosphate transport system substrate-binding protein
MKRLRRLALVLGVFGLAVSTSPYAVAAPSHTQITGTGSSWAANAVNQWIADVYKQGLVVGFTSTGSAQGRKDFAYKTTDFGVSDIAYQGRDPVTDAVDTSLGRKYAYLPIVAGGTSFPYHLSYAGRMIRNLRLSGLTIAKIFTNAIGYWDDPAIKADNNNKLLLPHIPIIPVVHSEGSGSTYQFTAYLAHEYGSIWSKFAGFSGPTEYFPRAGRQQAQSGSDGVMNFITSSAGNGAIGFDEYSYALLANFPVAKVLNANGYYTAPTQYNVAVALTKAKINYDKTSINYLTQDLSYVYGYHDDRVYPLSSYSYMIIPTGTNSTETKTSTTAQRQTLADFLYYSICQGQGEVGPIGYSPLPINLVQDGFGQIAKLKAADPNVDLTERNVSTCHNPTFIAGKPTVNYLAQVAPKPPACDKKGAGPCDANAGIITQNPGSNGGTSSGHGSGGSASGSAGGNHSGSSTGGTSSNSSATASASPSYDANGQLVNPVGNSGDGQDGGDGDILGQPTNLAAAQSSDAFNAVLYVLAFGLLIVLMVGPVLFNRFLVRRTEGKP